MTARRIKKSRQGKGQDFEKIGHEVDNEPGQDNGQIELDIEDDKFSGGIPAAKNFPVIFPGCQPQQRQVEEEQRHPRQAEQGRQMPLEG